MQAAGNGTSGRVARDRVLRPLGLSPEAVWFTDVVDRFFVKRNGRIGSGRQQGDAIDQDYATFACAVGLPQASLPTRPSIASLTRLAVTEHRNRLRRELCEANATTVVTLGEESRRVLAAVADECSGQPTMELNRRTLTIDTYGSPGRVIIGSLEARWFALVHPGQRNPEWAALHASWMARV